MYGFFHLHKIFYTLILIQDDLHHTHRLWLMNKINLYFGHSYVFAFYDCRTNITEVDLVISNYYIDTGKTPLLLMKNIPTERNWRLFEKTIYQLKKEKEVVKSAFCPEY